jgi:uncharacterized protein involved in response to NO
VLRREPYRLLFPLGALLAWAGVLPWLFFALRLRGIYEPVNDILAYRSFLHPLAELDGFLGCFAAGVVLTSLRPPPAAWQVVVAAIAPLISATCAALGHWQVGQLASLLLLAVVLEFTLQRLSRPWSASLLWIVLGFLMGAGGAALAELAAAKGSEWFWVHEMGRDLVIQGLFTGLAIAAGRVMRGGDRTHPALHLAAGAVFIASFWIGRRFGMHLGFAIRAAVTVWLALPLRPDWEFGPRNLRRSFAHLALWMLAVGNAWVAVAPTIRRAGLHVIFLGCFTALLLAALFPRPGERPAFPLRKLAWAGGLVALSMVGRVMVELDPTSFHLWMGLSAASFLAATIACLRVPVRAAQSV